MNRKKKWITAGIVLVLSMAMTAVILYQSDILSFGVTAKDPHAVEGTLEQLDEDMKDNFEKKVEPGQLGASINTAPAFRNGTSEGNLRIQNPAGNAYDMKVVIRLSDTNKKVYQSGKIKPGEYIERAKLTKNLKAGEYAADAEVTALDPENGKHIGSFEIPLLLTVQE